MTDSLPPVKLVPRGTLVKPGVDKLDIHSFQDEILVLVMSPDGMCLGYVTVTSPLLSLSVLPCSIWGDQCRSLSQTRNLTRTPREKE